MTKREFEALVAHLGAGRTLDVCGSLEPRDYTPDALFAYYQLAIVEGLLPPPRESPVRVKTIEIGRSPSPFRVEVRTTGALFEPRPSR